MMVDHLLIVTHCLGLTWVFLRTRGHPEAYLWAAAPISVLTLIHLAMNEWGGWSSPLPIEVMGFCGLCLLWTVRWFQLTGRNPDDPLDRESTFPFLRSSGQTDFVLGKVKEEIRLKAGQTPKILTDQELRRLLARSRRHHHDLARIRFDRAMGILGHGIGILLVGALLYRCL